MHPCTECGRLCHSRADEWQCRDCYDRSRRRVWTCLQCGQPCAPRATRCLACYHPHPSKTPCPDCGVLKQRQAGRCIRCRQIRDRQRVTHTCEFCQTSFVCYQRRPPNGWMRFCSKYCAGAFRRASTAEKAAARAAARAEAARQRELARYCRYCQQPMNGV